MLVIPLNPLPNDNISDLTKLKALADDNLKEAKMAEFVFDRVENIEGKWENAGYQNFLLFPQCFQSLKVEVSRYGLGEKNNSELIFSPFSVEVCFFTLRNAWANSDSPWSFSTGVSKSLSELRRFILLWKEKKARAVTKYPHQHFDRK